METWVVGSFLFWIFLFIICDLSRRAQCVNVHFENKEGGFFLKQTPRQHHFSAAAGPAVVPASVSDTGLLITGGTSSGGGGVVGGGASTLLSVDRFTVFQSSAPISVRATYGPFSTKQTVPARYVVPDPIPMNLTGTSADLQDLAATHHLDMSAHIVRSEIPRDSPVLRVLFHTGTDAAGRRQLLLHHHVHHSTASTRQVPTTIQTHQANQQQSAVHHHHHVCIVLHAAMSGSQAANYQPLTTSCSPDGEDGVCLAQVTVPANWWPPLPQPGKDGRAGKVVKTPPRLVQVAYSVQEPRPNEPYACEPQAQLQPTTVLGLVPLVPARAAYKELQLVDDLRILVPHPPLFPLSRIHIPVFLEREKANTITSVIIRGRVKSGVRLLGATATDPMGWNVTVETNPRHTGATVTAHRRIAPLPLAEQTSASGVGSQRNHQGEVIELLTWLVEVAEDAAEPYEDARIVWSARYEPQTDTVPSSFDQLQQVHHHHSQQPQQHRMENKKSATRLDIQKDDIQAVVPISKNWEVLNTAVLTGRQVSQAMKVFIVSQAGKAADVTFQASCHSEDDSVLKVSSSCSSVYVDGSEIRGSVNGSVLVKYGTYTGLARFTVWMPEFPLELQVPDTRLSQLKSWRVPDYQPSPVKLSKRSLQSYSRPRRSPRSASPSTYTSYTSNPYNDHLLLHPGNNIDGDRASSYNINSNANGKSSSTSSSSVNNCRLRYQQSAVDVYARFLASDHDSGRVTYLINRRSWLRVTDLVLGLMRVSDPRIASLRGRVLQGWSVGRTEVQVISPITGRVIGAKEIRVGNDKVGISKLSVQVVSGLQLNISPESSIENGYVAETSVTRKLTAQYQEGLLDIELEFSDGSRTPLREVSDSDYHLVVESLDPEIVAFAPMVASHHPRVIAVGEGSGDLLQVTLLLAEECRTSSVNGRGKSKQGSAPLQTAAASVVVDFSGSDLPHRPDILQNDGSSASSGSGHKQRDYGDLQDILKGGSDDDRIEPNVQARQYHGGKNKGGGIRTHQGMMTPLEISMYVLLAAFCFAIAIFVVSCVVYASKFKPDAAIEGLRASPIGSSGAGSGGSTRDNKKPMETTTTNAHDWVWLGRATIDSSSNRNSAAFNNNNIGAANSTNEMRITANPINMNYCDPDDVVVVATSGTSFSTHGPGPITVGGPVVGGALAADLALATRSVSHQVVIEPVPPNRKIDTSTYIKSRSGGRMTAVTIAEEEIGINGNEEDLQIWNKPNPPPPLPPHGIQPFTPPPHPTLEPTIADYRPPVPPHRNVNNTSSSNSSSAAGITSNTNNNLSTTPTATEQEQQQIPQTGVDVSSPTRQQHRHHHHHHHHHAGAVHKSAGIGAVSKISLVGNHRSGFVGMRELEQFARLGERGHGGDGVVRRELLDYERSRLTTISSTDDDDGGFAIRRSVFQFDDDAESSTTTAAVRNIVIPSTSDIDIVPPPVPKHGISRDDDGHEQDTNNKDDDGFVMCNRRDILSSQNDCVRNNAVIKRATIVGNPMFSTIENKQEEETNTDMAGLSGLDGLDMDYDQIMHYFDNLKESNA